MTGEFNRLQTRNALGRFDDALKSPTPAPQVALNGNVPPAVAQPQLHPTEHEQRLWLWQQQQPDAVLKQVVAYRLSGKLDVMRLISALQTLVLTMPDLLCRYQFDDEGELRKIPAANNGQYIEIVTANTADEITDVVLARQAAPWNCEEQPPFHAVVILNGNSISRDTNGQAVLALMVHRIVDEIYPIEWVLRNLSAAYNGTPLLTSQPGQLLTIPAIANAKAPIEWARRGQTAATTVISRSSSSPAGDRAAHRYSAVITADMLKRGGITERAIVHPIAHIAAQFAAFVRHLGGHEKIGLWVSVSGSNISGPDDAVAMIQSQLDQRSVLAAHPSENTSDVPHVAFTWLSGSEAAFALDGLKHERLLLPTLENRADLELAAGLTAEEKITLELITGQAVSSHIGGFLLERFLAFLQGEQIAQPMLGTVGAVVQAEPSSEALDAPVDRDRIAAIILSEFREALGLAQMDLHDDFFDQGGHSLIATRIIGRLLGAHGIEVHFNDLFSNPTAASLAQHATLVAPLHAETQTAGSEDRSLKAPLAHAQMSLWKAYAAFGYGEIFNLPFALDFMDPVDEAVFAQAFLDILVRHPGLRTLFFQQQDTVLQSVVPVEQLAQYKWFWTSAESQGVDRHMEAGYHFDLAKELPIRLRFLTDAETGRQVLSFLFHHIVLDEWSVNLMMDELAVAYQARAAGKAPVWSTEPAPFHEFAHQQFAEGVNAEHLAYWTDMLHDAPKGLALFEQKEQIEQEPSEVSAAGGWVEFKLASDVTEGLYATAKNNSASLFNIVYAAISAALYRLGNLKDLVIGTSASGRTDHMFFDTVGYFTTVVAHRVRFQRDMSIGDLVAAVKNTVNESMPYSDIPIDLVEEALGMMPGRDHLFSVFIQIHAKNKLNGTLQSVDGKTIDFRQVDPDRHESMLGLHFEVMEELIGGERSIRVLMSYRAAEYGPEQVEQIKNTTNSVFALFAQPGASDLPLSA